MINPAQLTTRNEPAATGSAALFYDDDVVLLNQVLAQARITLADGGSVVLIATQEHADQIAQRLRLEGTFVDAAVMSGRYVTIDANSLLANLTLDGLPDEVRFRRDVGTAIARVGLRGSRVWVFAELMGLLCERGLEAAALRVSEQWHRLAEQFSFNLLCACPAWAIGDASQRAHVFALFDRDVTQDGDTDADAAPLPRQRELDLGSDGAAAPKSTTRGRPGLAAVRSQPLRAGVDRRLERLVAIAEERGVEAAVVYVNLDRFAQVIETLGLAAASELLEVAEQRIAACADDEVPVERLGNDEFAIFLDGRSLGDATTRIARRIIAAFREPLEAGPHRVIVTPSIGIEVTSASSTDVDGLIRHARLAMRSAKRLGGNTYQNFNPDLENAVRARFDMEQKMRQALTSNEFLLHYQPVYNLGTGEIESLEALVRWQPPGAAVVSPANFIPLAEETGLIVELGDWVLRAACLQALSLQRAGFRDLQVAVNFSARQLREPRVASRVQRALQETGLDAGCLVLELTESMQLDDSDAVRFALWALKALGLRLALDDFGTGYSSFACLKCLPVDILKIDQSFVRDIGKDRESEAIVRSIIAIGRSMKLHVIAEGVETEEQFAFLAESGCHAVQGYLLGRPSAHERLLPALSTAAALARRRSLDLPRA